MKKQTQVLAWSDAEVSRLLELVEEKHEKGFTYTYIAEVLHKEGHTKVPRTESSISNRVSKLRKEGLISLNKPVEMNKPVELEIESDSDIEVDVDVEYKITLRGLQTVSCSRGQSLEDLKFGILQSLEMGSRCSSDLHDLVELMSLLNTDVKIYDIKV